MCVRGFDFIGKKLLGLNLQGHKFLDFVARTFLKKIPILAAFCVVSKPSDKIKLLILIMLLTYRLSPKQPLKNSHIRVFGLNCFRSVDSRHVSKPPHFTAALMLVINDKHARLQTSKL